MIILIALDLEDYPITALPCLIIKTTYILQSIIQFINIFNY